MRRLVRLVRIDGTLYNPTHIVGIRAREGDLGRYWYVEVLLSSGHAVIAGESYESEKEAVEYQTLVGETVDAALAVPRS